MVLCLDAVFKVVGCDSSREAILDGALQLKSEAFSGHAVFGAAWRLLERKGRNPSPGVCLEVMREEAQTLKIMERGDGPLSNLFNCNSAATRHYLLQTLAHQIVSFLEKPLEEVRRPTPKGRTFEEIAQHVQADSQKEKDVVSRVMKKLKESGFVEERSGKISLREGKIAKALPPLAFREFREFLNTETSGITASNSRPSVRAA